jgi:endoglucanase
VNPLALVYLTNMDAYGATKSLSVMFSAWFTGTPPPGFVVAGANPGYDWDTCCDYDAGSVNACGGGFDLNLCGAAPLSPPFGQPPQKSYRDFNTNWPLDSWQVSEANNAYMAQYIRLVSKFATP